MLQFTLMDRQRWSVNINHTNETRIEVNDDNKDKGKITCRDQMRFYWKNK